MKIGDRIYVHGYVDEIRKDCVIIRNNGGYFGTDKSEIIEAPQNKEDVVSVVRCKICKYYHSKYNGGCANFADVILTEDDYCSRAERKEE